METDAFGASVGKLDDLASSGLKNDFNNIPNNDVFGQSDRVQPRQVATGVTRGTWRINNSDGSYITVGVIPETTDDFGIAFFNSNGNMISKNQGNTQYVYDVANNKNIIQIGLLPDDTYGFVVAKSGYDVSEAFDG